MRTLFVLTVIVLVLPLAACTDGDDTPDPSPTRSSEASPKTLIGPGADIPNDTAARGDVTTARCQQVEGRRWRVVAEATNSTDAPARYRLALRFADADDGSVLARQALDTTVIQPGESERIVSAARLERRADTVNCVFVAVERVEG